MVGGTIGFAYNKPGCDLKLTQEQAVKVAMSTIRDWKEIGSEGRFSAARLLELELEVDTFGAILIGAGTGSDSGT